jgi:small-conductance mechanosensitive channel
MFVIVMLMFFTASRLFNRLFIGKIMTRMNVEEGTRYNMLRVIHYLIMIIGAIVAFQFIGIDLSGLAVIFGLLSVGIGFGLQNVTSNFIAGLILLFERPIKIGDRITVGDTEGDVMEINIRSTTIKTLNNITIIVPNSEFISSNVINWSHGDPKIRINILVGVSYGSDIDTVIKALREVADEHPEALKIPKPDILLRSFGDSSWDMDLRIWISKPQRHHIIRSELNIAIVRKFRKYGVEIPFPQRDLHLRSPLPVPLSVNEYSDHGK